jgi:serine/threonine-protein kinase RsbW
LAGERPMRRRLRQRLPATPASVAVARALIGGFIDELGFPRSAWFNVALAVTEAAANAARHAYAGRTPGAFDLEARVEGDSLRIDVRDYGAWRAPRRARTGMNVGLVLMQEASDACTVSRVDPGTLVSLRFRLPG